MQAVGSLRSVVATAALLAGLAAVFVGLPQVAVGSTPAAPAHGWIIGTPPVGGYGVILHTTNDGQLWVRQGSTKDIPNVVLNNVKAVDSGTAWVVGYNDSGYGVVLRTSDAGQTWARRGGPGIIPDQPLFGVGPVGRGVAWVVGGHGAILRTADGGKTWTRQVSGTIATLREVEAVDRQTAWIAGDAAGGYGVLLHTTDGGKSWVRQGTAATITDNNLIDLTVVDARTAWAVGGHGLLVKTADGGLHWDSQMAYGLSDNNGASAVNGSTAWVASDYGAMHRTTDGGAEWSEQNPTLPGQFYLLGVSALGPSTAWVVGGGVVPPAGGIILHTTDAGATWQTQTTPVDVTLRRVSFVEPAPVTTVSGVPAGWVRHSVTLRFSAAPAAGGAPVACTEYRLGSGAWTHGTQVTIRRQGVTTVAYRSADTAGNVEVARRCTVRIDGVPPTVVDIGTVVAWHGGAAHFAYRLGDPAVTSLHARLVITRYGRRVASVDLGKRPTGRRLVAALRCVWPTSQYRWRMIVTDPTGRRTVGAARILSVLPSRSRL